MDSLRLSFGIISTILLLLIPLPQIIHTLKEKDASQLSLYFILFQILANSVLLAYAFVILDVFLIISNTGLILQNTYLLILKEYYRRMSNTDSNNEITNHTMGVGATVNAIAETYDDSENNSGESKV